MEHIKDAWSQFVQNGQDHQLLVPADILDSWSYCRQLSVNPFLEKGNQFVTPQKLKQLQQKNQRLIQLISYEVAHAQNKIQTSDFLFILTDSQGVVLWQKGHLNTRQSAADIGFLTGSYWTEKAVGTNAIGLSLRKKEPVVIDGYQHYTVASHNWSCAAIPIFDEDQLVGILDVSRINTHQSLDYQMILFALEIIVDHVQQQFKQDYLLEQQALLKYMLNDRLDGIICDTKNKIVSIRGLPIENLQKEYGQVLTASMEIYWNLGEAQGINSNNQTIGYFYPFCVDQLIHKKTCFNVQLSTTSFKTIGIEPKSICYIKMLEKLKLAAKSELPVYIYGETGSGKEVAMEMIYKNSPRKEQRLVTINCGALPESLLESELFGYEKGAFTGANASGYQGKLLLAHQGTLFLDEIETMSNKMQVALLRVLQQKKVTPIGSSEEYPADFRLITASNQDIKELVRQGKFREDLYYRIYTCVLNIPPLRERLEDLDEYIYTFFEDNNWEVSWENYVCQELHGYSWAGNFRELHSVLEKIYLYYPERKPTKAEIHKLVQEGALQNETTECTNYDQEQRQKILSALAENIYHMGNTAKALNISRSTLYRKIKRYHIEVN